MPFHGKSLNMINYIMGEAWVLNEETTEILEEEIYKKVEESLNTNAVKSEMQSRIEGGRKNLIEGVTL
jgi:arginine/glutamate-rich protein 1